MVGGAALSAFPYRQGMTDLDMRLPIGVRTASVAEREEAGRAARSRRPRTDLAGFTLAPDRPDPVALLGAQETVRVQALLPLRHSRMSVSPFTFYRGAAAVMANDLGRMPNSGLITQLCGDAHLSNFGLFGAPDRSLVFDVNDFDETNPGPFEWDVYRLATSFVLAGRDNKLDEESIRNAVTAVGFGYRTQMTGYASMSDLDVWYDRIDIEVIKQWARNDGLATSDKAIEKSAAKAQSRNAWSAISKMTEVIDGKRQFINQPPLLLRLPMDGDIADRVQGLIEQYRNTLPADRARLARRYHLVDAGHKVVGVGSVGLLAVVILMQGRDPNDLLVLQAKQAVPSVLEEFTAPSVFPNHGQRVVAGQQLMQAASDIFLGWIEAAAGRQYYIRQLRDMKFSPDPSQLHETSLLGYAVMCGRTLARAHARGGDAVAIGAYLGTSAKFDKAIRDFSFAYAEQVDKDFATYSAAIAAGTISLENDEQAKNLRVQATGHGLDIVDPTASTDSSVAAPASGTSPSS